MAHRLLQLARVSAWTLLGAVAFVTLGPLGDRPHLTQDPQAERSFAYFTLGYAFALAYPRSRVAVAVGVMVGAFGLEATQLLTVDRHAHVRDAVAKSLGGLLGVAAVAIAQAFASACVEHRRSQDAEVGASPSA